MGKGDTTEKSNAIKKRKDAKGYRAKTGWPTIIASGVIILLILVLAAIGELPVLGDAQNQWSPFVFTLVGVVLYVMASAKSRRDRFDLRYAPDYFFRGAQAVVYLYVIMSIIAQMKAEPSTQYNFVSWPPNLIGLLVGMFILHVEKAMEGLGQRFEEVLAGLLPRALTAKTSREKQLERLRVEQKFQEIKMQSEGLISQMRDTNTISDLKAHLDAVSQTIRDGDLDGTQDAVSQLAWKFEGLKQALREEELTVQEILSADRYKQD